MLPEEQAESTRYLYELASGRFGWSIDHVRAVQAFHFKFGQGAKTGTGGGQGGSGVSLGGGPDFERIPFFPGNTPNSGGGIFGIFTEKLNVPVLLSLMQDGHHGNLLSSPFVLANDNEQSKIETSRQVGTRATNRSGMPAPCGVRSALRRLHGSQAQTVLSQVLRPPRDGGTTWSMVVPRSPQ